MATKDIRVNVSRNRKLENIIWMFFTQSGVLFSCNDCSKLVRGYNYLLKQHLKVDHEDLWIDYLSKIGSEMTRKTTFPVHTRKEALKDTSLPPPQGHFLKCQVSCKSGDGPATKLSLPESRETRKSVSNDNLIVSENLEGFKGRIQMEYNTDPIGPYMGPFDQHADLPMKLQLPLSSLSFDSYTEFVHDEEGICQNFSIKSSYKSIDDHEKIDSLKLGNDESEECDDINEDEETIVYTCLFKKCKIPCICKDCCMREPQCEIHKIRHDEKFNYEEDSMTIRSSEIFFKDSSFLSNSYTIRYANIPVRCHNCAKDLLHHNLYHLKYHESCKFCLQIRHKLTPTTRIGFQREVKDHDLYMQLICPDCDRKFASVNKKKRHIDYTHGNINRFNCSQCKKTFASQEALKHHGDVTHKVTETVKCDECGTSFTSKVNLNNHKKYAHSSVKGIKCSLCETSFKQRRDLNFHLANIHEIDRNDHYMNTLNDNEDKPRFECNLCDKTYKYKKDLTKHTKITHHIPEQNNQKDSDQLADDRYKCELCGLSYKNKKSLNEHKQIKHEDISFNCSICGKSFNQKNNCTRHERNHEKE